MNFRFHPEAELEFLEAVEYYEEVETGLGQEFALEVYAAIQRAVSYPKAWPELEDEVRRSLVRRFPYGVLYFEEDEYVLVLAVMHLHRDPEYWKGRK